MLKIIEPVNNDGFCLLGRDCFTWTKERLYQFTFVTGLDINPFPLLVRRKEQKPELKNRIELLFLEKVSRVKNRIKEANSIISIIS